MSHIYMKNPNSKSKRISSIFTLLIVIGFTFFLFAKLGPHLSYYINKQEGKAVVLEKDGNILKYKYLDTTVNIYFIHERMLKYNSPLKDFRSGDSFDIFYSDSSDIIYIVAEDSHTYIFLYAITLIFCLMACYFYLKKLL